MAQMSDTATATVRTAVPTAWATVIAWAVGRFGLDLSGAEWQVLCLALPVIGGVFYRLARVVEARWPVAGYVLFGSPRTPAYAARSTGETR